MENYVIMMAGLPGTGKTSVAKNLKYNLKNYIMISQNDLRRAQGMKKMPKTQDKILRDIDILIANYLREGKGIIFDSVNRHTSRRNQIYGVASCCGKKVIALECICSEETAKKRIEGRPFSDGLLSDPNDPKVYDKLKSTWEDISVDFKHPGNSHVSYLSYNTEDSNLLIYNYTLGVKNFINKIEKFIKSTH